MSAGLSAQLFLRVCVCVHFVVTLDTTLGGRACVVHVGTRYSSLKRLYIDVAWLWVTLRTCAMTSITDTLLSGVLRAVHVEGSIAAQVVITGGVVVSFDYQSVLYNAMSCLDRLHVDIHATTTNVAV